MCYTVIHRLINTPCCRARLGYWGSTGSKWRREGPWGWGGLGRVLGGGWGLLMVDRRAFWLAECLCKGPRRTSAHRPREQWAAEYGWSGEGGRGLCGWTAPKGPCDRLVLGTVECGPGRKTGKSHPGHLGYRRVGWGEGTYLEKARPCPKGLLLTGGWAVSMRPGL